jgi:hypothetical protein
MWPAEDLRDAFNERAAIIEFDGGPIQTQSVSKIEVVVVDAQKG